MTADPVLPIYLGDVVRLRRTHPCGGGTWLVDRLGADIGLRCETCGRHVLLERRTLERRLAGVVSPGDSGVSAAVAGGGAGCPRPHPSPNPRRGALSQSFATADSCACGCPRRRPR